VHYKRGLYILEDSIENRRLRGTTATVSEAEDGTVTIRAQGRVLAARRHLKDEAHLEPGAVVAHQHLAGAFEWIAARQRARDAGRLASSTVTLREKKRIEPPRLRPDAASQKRTSVLWRRSQVSSQRNPAN